jgi:molecular chaperone GrpE
VLENQGRASRERILEELSNDLGIDAAAPTDAAETPEARIEQLEDKLARARAELQNAQRRHRVERGQAIRYANTEVMKSLLGVIDDFERSLAAAEDSDNLQAVVDGVRLVYENLTKALRDHGLTLIPALHEPFDPEVHEAMMQQPSAEFPSGTVLNEVARGYRLHDRVVRPSKVIVSKEPDGEECGQPQADDVATATDGETP